MKKLFAVLYITLLLASCSNNSVETDNSVTESPVSSVENVSSEADPTAEKTEEPNAPVIIDKENMTESESQLYEKISQKRLLALLFMDTDLTECTLSCPIRVYNADYETYDETKTYFYVLADGEIKYVIRESGTVEKDIDEFAVYAYQNHLPITYIESTGADHEGQPIPELKPIPLGESIDLYFVYYSDGEFYGTGSNYTRLPEDFSPEKVNIANLTPQYITDMGEPIKASETLEEALEIIS